MTFALAKKPEAKASSIKPAQTERANRSATSSQDNPVWQALALRSSGVQGKLIQRQAGDAGPSQQTPTQQPPTPPTPAQQPSQQTPNLLKIYSFGPTGAGRVERASGTTIFPPAAPVDANGNELVRAGTTAQPILSRWGRYFTVDERERPLTPPVPDSSIVEETHWRADDRSQEWRNSQRVTGTYYGPGQPLGSTLGSEYILRNDRPGVMYVAYVLSNATAPDFLISIHQAHYVNDENARPGATVLPDHPGAPPP